MNIVIVNSFYYPEIEGGAEYSVKMLSEKLVQMGNKVTVLCTGQNESTEVINGVNVIRFKSHCIKRAKECINANSAIRKIHRILDIYNPFNYRLLNNLLKRLKPDIIHTNGLYDISPVIWTVAKNNRIPIIHTLRDYYLICEHGNMLRRNNNHACQSTKALCNIYRLVNSNYANIVDVVTAPSQITLNTVCDAGLFKNSKKDVVFNASDCNITEIVQLAKEKTVKINQIKNYKFVFLGTLAEHKGIKWLINSFMELENPNVQLIVAGKGPLEKYVEESQNKDKRIVFKGFINSNEIKSILEDAYMVVCPSLWNEPFGRVVLDAYQMDIPVIATKLGALPSIVDDHVTGYLVDPNNNDLLNIMKESLENLELYRQLINNIPKFMEKFTIDHQTKEFLKLYSYAREKYEQR